MKMWINPSHQESLQEKERERKRRAEEKRARDSERRVRLFT